MTSTLDRQCSLYTKPTCSIPEHALDIEERKEILQRVLEHDRMHILLPEYAKNKRLTILN
jgi:hypothetical protein